MHTKTFDILFLASIPPGFVSTWRRTFRLLLLGAFFAICLSFSHFSNAGACDRLLSTVAPNSHLPEWMVLSTRGALQDRRQGTFTLPQTLLSSQDVLEIWENLPQGWRYIMGPAGRIYISPFATSFADDDPNLARKIKEAQSELEKSLDTRVFAKIKIYVQAITELILKALPEENLYYADADIRIMNSTQHVVEQFKLAEGFHVDGQAITVIAPLIGPGTLVAKRTGDQRQISNDEILIMTNQERMKKTAIQGTLHASPPVRNQDRLVIIIRFNYLE